jgi:nucleoside-diphosphate-sugar epimerase
MRILVTGATGFIGHALCRRFIADGMQVFCTVRSARQVEKLPAGVRALATTTIGPETDYTGFMDNIDIVVHLAARVHVLCNDAADSLDAFRAENVEASANLARQVASAGVRRLVFLSTVKVHGEGGERSYREEDRPEPVDAYGQSKLEAEEELAAIMFDTGLEVVVLRSPLVYGPGVKANFLQLLKLVSRGVPLPLSSVRNRRSMIYLGNLVDAIVTCARKPRAAGQTYLVSDGEDVSTPELIRRIAATLGRPARLFPLEPAILRFLGRATGRAGMFDRLLCSLAVDSGKIRRELGWHPPYTMQDGLASTAIWYKNLDSRKG